jgi:hypothetical protein
VTRCRSTACPWPENEDLPLLLNASYAPRGRICGLPSIRQVNPQIVSELPTIQELVVRKRRGGTCGLPGECCTSTDFPEGDPGASGVAHRQVGLSPEQWKWVADDTDLEEPA